MLMKKVFLATALVGSLFVTSFAADAVKLDPNTDMQCFPKAELMSLNKEKVAGGTGILYGEFSFERTKALPDSAIKEIGWMTLRQGAGIGLHKHSINEDTYIIVSGEGIFQDGTGRTTVVKAGDITIARPGQSHALKNVKKEPLVFLDIIAQNDSYKQHHPDVVKK